MPRKSSKSTRRSRAKKQEAAKKKSATVTAAAVMIEGSDEPVMATIEPAEKPIQAAVEAEIEKMTHESLDELLQPTRNRMLVSACALGVIIIALIFGAAVIHQQKMNHQAEQAAKSGQDSGKADQILQSGGNVCTNGSSQTDTTGSVNPGSVGMMLQSNPVSTVQTPESLGNGTDVTTLQGASCF